MRTVEPIGRSGRGSWARDVYAHYVDLKGDYRDGVQTAKCRDCDWSGRYPSRDHARAVADEHMIRSHATGADFCAMTPNGAHTMARAWCSGCAAIKRRNARWSATIHI